MHTNVTPYTHTHTQHTQGTLQKKWHFLRTEAGIHNPDTEKVTKVTLTLHSNHK